MNDRLPNAGHWNAVACTALAQAWVEAGVRHAVIAPGSRSAPLAVALARTPGMNCTVVLDERAAGFRALGIGMATGMPAVVLCTSGTAGTHLHAPIVEAFHARVPMIVCTADRPPELHGVGAPQTIDQRALFGTAVRAFYEPGPPDDHADFSAARMAFEDMATFSVTTATGEPQRSPRGPVHLNLAFREPLLIAAGDAAPVAVPTLRSSSVTPSPSPSPSLSPSLSPSPSGWDSASDSAMRLATNVAGEIKGLLVLGFGADVEAEVVARFTAATGWPVIAETISNQRVFQEAISHYEALLRCSQWAQAHRPEFVIRIGGALTSKTLLQWLDPSIPQALLDADGMWADPLGAVAHRVKGAPNEVLAVLADTCDVSSEMASDRMAWRDAWCGANERARQAINAVLDRETTPTEPRVARDVFSDLRDGTNVLVASSMPVRDLDWFVAPRAGVSVFANRGANGIDGLVSTAVGLATGSGQPTLLITGDLALLHDASGLLNAKASGVALTIVVIDNGGGGIFSFLPQAELCEPTEFELLFGTPQAVDIAAVIGGYGVSVIEVDRAEALTEAVNRSLAVGSVRAVLVRTNRDENVELHRRCWAAAAYALTND